MRAFSLVIALACAHAFADDPQTIADKMKGLTIRPGLIESYLDAKGAKVYLKLPAPKPDGMIGSYLYCASLVTGVGSNPLGIDRSQFGGAEVLNLKMAGNKVIFEVPNLNYRAENGGVDEQRAVRENFASSVIWATAPVVMDKDGSILIDITGFIVRDSSRVTERVTGLTFDAERSTLDIPNSKAFPDNLELQAEVTLTGRATGELAAHLPDSHSLTVIERQSIIRLPEADGYKPRKHDVRSGFFARQYLDFSQPLASPLAMALSNRHRLSKDKPIVYYIDRGVPEPMKSALIEGGNYWGKAFAAAGFPDGFRVEEMPEGMDPMDLRYNVVQWMDRSTRGYAYGQSVVDPRTGEILKGAVNLDALRARQDILVLEGLLGAGKTGSGAADDPVQIAMGRIRQLGAHEIGHTLGLRHNLASSTYGDRASVMDYPAPKISLKNGKLDTSDAYAKGVGIWDIQAIRWGYTQYASDAEEKAGCEAILKENAVKGYVYMTDDDTSDDLGANPGTNRFDNGKNVLDDLAEAIRVRAYGIERFGPGNLAAGQPIVRLEEVFGPLYFYHRYDVDGAAKMIGGLWYAHTVNGDGRVPQQPVPAAAQMRALDLLMQCLSPQFLAVPEKVAKLMGPWAPDLPQGERFTARAQYAFDSLAAAETGADLVLSRVLAPARLQRVAVLHARDASLPSVDSIVQKVVGGVMSAGDTSIGQVEQRLLIERLMALASDSDYPEASAEGEAHLRKLLSILRARTDAFAVTMSARVAAFLNRPWQGRKNFTPVAPLPGAPIGG